MGDSIADAARTVARKIADAEPRGDWTAPETVLALLIAVYGDPSKLGGSKPRADGTERQSPAVSAVASAIGRTTGSVVMKVMNLRTELTGGERGLSHGSKLDRAITDRYRHHLDMLVVDALIVAQHINGAMNAIDAVVPRAIAAGVDDDDGRHADYMAGDASDAADTERMAQVALRKGQGVFRGRVLANYAHSCAFCGLRSRKPEDNSYLLLASHIRPWASSTGHQRLDPANGLSLCAIHDRAFDWGFLTVDEQHLIVASDHARDHYAPEERVRAEILDLHGTPLRHPARHFVEPGAEYMAHHREQVFERRFRRGA